METIKKLRKNVYFKYTLLFIIVAFFTFFWFIVYGKTFINGDDAFAQHYPFLVKFKRFLSDIIDGNGVSLWTWDTALGSDTIGNFAFVFCDPFAFIGALFSEKYMDLGYTVSVILRLYAAGLAMMSFLRYKKKASWQCLVGGIAYAFSAWAVMTSVRHGFFLNPLVFFPLLIMGVDKIDNEKKPLIFVISIVLSLITSFYFAYMSALLVIVYIVIKYFIESENRKSFQDFLKRFFKFVFYAVIALLISAPIFIPVFYSLIYANKSSGVDINIFLRLKEVLRYIPSYLSHSDVNGNYSYTALSMICIALVPAMIIDFKKKLNRLPTLMTLICAVMAAFPIFGSIFNAMSYSVGRWCYMLAFFFVWASVSALDFEKFKDSEYKKSYRTIFAVMAILFIVALILSKVFFNVFPDKNLYIALLNMSFLFIFYIILCESEKCKRTSKSVLIIILMVVNLCIVGLINYSPNLSNDLSKYNNIKKPYKQYSRSAQRVGLKIKDDDFYRVDQIENSTPTGCTSFTRTPINESIFFGTRSIYSYISTIDDRIFDYNKALCNSSGYYRRVCTFSNDNRSRMNFLQGVKYFIGDNKNRDLKASQYAGYDYKKYHNIDGVEVLKNKYNASLGYVFQNTISEKNFMKYDYLDREQIMMQACVVSDAQETSSPKINENDIILDTNKIEYKIKSENGLKLNGNKIKVESTSSRLTISTSEIKNSEVYIVFKNLKKKPLTYDQYKKSVLGDNYDSKMESNKLDAQKISYYSYGDFEIFVSKSNIRKRLINTEGENQAFRDVKDFTANLGYYDSTSGDINIDFKSIGDYTFDSIEVIAVSQDNFDNQARKLENNRLNVTTLHDNYIKGTVNAEADGLLYLSIPYNEGWKIYIDGKEQESYVADIAFTGVDIKKGNHTVELKYRPVGFTAGLCMSAFGTVVLIIILVYKSKKRKNEKV